MKIVLVLFSFFFLTIQAQTVTLAAAGDVACITKEALSETRCQMVATSDLILKEHVQAVLALGDLQYPSGTLSDFQSSYGLSWGRFKDITYPVAGNHEYRTENAQGYFDYFGIVAGDKTKGYYSFDLGAWHLLALNSNCNDVSCDEGSEQVKWLEADLASHPTLCTLAFWHHPRFSSGPHGNSDRSIAFWNSLQNHKADLILTGHDHLYERFASRSSDGTLDPNGIRQFVVGTGGKQLYAILNLFPQSEKVYNKNFGILFLNLEPASYSWRFVTTTGEVIDAGQEKCVE
jgi:acid phosphatase type 7